MSYKKELLISGSQCGFNAELNIIGAFAIVQDAATELMKSLNIDGITAQRKYGAMWVFSKNKIKFSQDSFWGDMVYIESFISNITLVRFNIETIVKNSIGEIIILAKTEICGIDLETKKIRPVETVGVSKTMLENIFDTSINFSKNPAKPQQIFATDKVKSSNIDFCHHTNNVEYIRFIVNAYSVEELYKKKIKEFEIDYINQSFENDTLNIYLERINNIDVIEIKKDDLCIVKCELTFNS